MIDRVALDRQPLFDPTGQLRVQGVDTIGHDADGGASVDFDQTVENGSQVAFIRSGITHVINPQRNDRFDAFLADPLWGDQSWERLVDVVRVGRIVKVDQSVAVAADSSSTERNQYE